jgi:hypothetical protein
MLEYKQATLKNVLNFHEMKVYIYIYGEKISLKPYSHHITPNLYFKGKIL